MKTNARTKPIAVEETARAFESDIANADALRASALTGLQRLRAAKANHIQREQTRLAGELGEEHPDVVRLKAELAGDQRFVRELGAEIDRAKAETPVVDKRGWALHGHVRNEDLEGQSGLTVALFDPAGRWVEVLGHACTDRSGYFKLLYQQSTAGKNDAATVNVRSELFIRVSDKKKKVLHTEKTPVVVQPGAVEYRNIILGAEDSCVPPETPSSAPTVSVSAKSRATGKRGGGSKKSK